jgi:hypothetical protein
MRKVKNVEKIYIVAEIIALKSVLKVFKNGKKIVFEGVGRRGLP